MSEYPSNSNHGYNPTYGGYQSSYKTLLEYPEVEVDPTIKARMIEAVAYAKSVARDDILARVIYQEDKAKSMQYKACVYKKPYATKTEGYMSKTYKDGKWVEEWRPSSTTTSYVYAMEDASAETAEEAIKLFFTAMAKSILNNRKPKEKEFAKLERELACMDHVYSRICSYADQVELDATKEKLKDKPEEKTETKPAETRKDLPTLPAIPNNPTITEAENKKICSL